MGYTGKGIARNIWSVVAGVLISLLIIIPIGFIVALISFSDVSIPQTQIIFSDVLLIGGIIAGCFFGGYTTARISTHSDIIHGFLTGLILTFLYALVNDYQFNLKYPDIGIAYFGFIPVVLIGSLTAIKRK